MVKRVYVRYVEKMTGDTVVYLEERGLSLCAISEEMQVVNREGECSNEGIDFAQTSICCMLRKVAATMIGSVLSVC